MIVVYVTYDTQTSTWNIMNGSECLFYGTVWQVEEWLIKNNDKYTEVK